MNDLSWPNTLEIEPPTPQKAPDRPRRQTVPAGTGKKTHTGPAETQAADPARKKRKVLLVADLFCGAGGSSTGAKRALEALGYEMLLTCVNHWPIAIETHKKNHPKARHYCQDVATLRPLEAVPEGRLDILMASPTCTHHSRARGGRPTSDQQRMDPWHVVTWLTELRVKILLIENVPEFVEWGPVDARTGKPIQSQKGAYFRAWLEAIKALGFNLQWQILNAADYGDATTRNRFFMQARSDRKPIRFPKPSHSRDGKPDLFGEGDMRWRSAREVIEWDKPGKSLWGRRKGLASKTLDRTLAGARKFNWPTAYVNALLPLLKRQLEAEIADAETLISDGPAIRKQLKKALSDGEAALSGKQADEKQRLHAKKAVKAATTKLARLEKGLAKAPGTIAYARKRLDKLATEMATTPGPARDAHIQPVVVVLRNHGEARSIDAPLPTVVAQGTHIALNRHGENGSARGHSVDDPVPTPTTRGAGYLVEPGAEPLILGQQGGATARSADQPLPTIATGGFIRLFTADMKPILVSVTGADKPKATKDVDQPLGTITTKNGVGVAEPVASLINLKGRSAVADIDSPAPAITTIAHLSVAQPLVSPYYGSGSGKTCKSVEEPLDTVTTKPRFGLSEAEMTPFVISPRHGKPGAGPSPRSVEQPLPTLTAGGSQVGVVEPDAEPFVFPVNQGPDRQRGLRAVSRPLPTILTRDSLAVVEPQTKPFLVPQFGEREGQEPRTHDIDNPMPAVTGHGAGALVEPCLIVVAHGVGEKEKNHTNRRARNIDQPLPSITAGGNQYAVAEPHMEPIMVQTDQQSSSGVIRSMDEPVPTVVTKRNVALVEPEAHALTAHDIEHLQSLSDQGRLVLIDGTLCVIDIRFRMLINPELARAMGFSDEESEYEFHGTESEITKQIGNAVPVNTATALITAALT